MGKFKILVITTSMNGGAAHSVIDFDTEPEAEIALKAIGAPSATNVYRLYERTQVPENRRVFGG